MLDVALFREHSIQLNGDWKNFVCTAEMDQSQPCPICESGDRSSLVGVLTVIDHIPRVIQRGANAGKTTKDKKKLYVAKMHTIKILTELAKDCGGSLAGKTFKVSRMGDKAAAVGETFFPLESFDSLEAVAAKYGLTLDDVQPADLEKEIVYRSPEELVAIGAGKSPFVASSAPKGVNDLSNQL